MGLLTHTGPQALQRGARVSFQVQGGSLFLALKGVGGWSSEGEEKLQRNKKP